MNKKRKPRKELPLVVNIIVILLFTVVFILFGICMGFFINTFINPTNDRLMSVLYTLVTGFIYMILLIILLRNSDSENIQPLKWYINCILISFILTLIVTAITVFMLGSDDSIINYIIGFLMFPFIGIISTPNVVKHTLKDTQKWKSILYDKGNLHKIKNSKDFYKVETPVPFEKEIISAIYKNEFLNVLVVVGIMLIVIYLSVHHMISDNSYTNNLAFNLIKIRANRGFGFMGFLMIIFLAFGIPIISFYVCNFIKKIRVVKKHEYLAYHVIVSRVNNSKIAIYDKNINYKYNYCYCVDIKEKEIDHSPATLIFIPDDVLLFPDYEEYQVNKYKEKK